MNFKLFHIKCFFVVKFKKMMFDSPLQIVKDFVNTKIIISIFNVNINL